jgi:hypothetical protein
MLGPVECCAPRRQCFDLERWFGKQETLWLKDIVLMASTKSFKK